MKTLIIYISIHHGNTEKIAKAIADILDAKITKSHKVDIDNLSEYDLIGFGSGIYVGKHHRSLLNLVDELPTLKNKKAFMFSTSGVRNGILQLPYGCDYNRALRNKLLNKGFNILGEFSCRGFDTVGPFKLIGGICKGRPNEEDLENAENFARSLRTI
jgi:flavodoxin